MILIDPPTWPAHGTWFSHLVSDSSLVELHHFARVLGVPARAFDRDHYDLAQGRYDQAVAAGASAVSARELVQRLRRSGLRLPKRTAQRDHDRRRRSLRAAWSELPAQNTSLGEELLARWDEPSRRYHNQDHLYECLAAVAELWPDRPPTVDLAAWFHDAVYDGQPGEDEEASAVLAEDRLSGQLPADAVAEVARLVRLTAGHRADEGDLAGQVLSDADLSILAAPPQRYVGYLIGIAAEYHHVGVDAFAEGRRAILIQLLQMPQLFGTSQGRERWEMLARANLEAELAGAFG